jgi:hypothetical protein
MEGVNGALKLIETARQKLAFYMIENDQSAELILVMSLLNEAIDKILDK